MQMQTLLAGHFGLRGARQAFLQTGEKHLWKGTPAQAARGAGGTSDTSSFEFTL